MRIIAIFLACFGCCWAQVSPNKLCIDNYNHDACQQIARDQDMLCQSVSAKTDCIIDAGLGLPTLTVLSPEEAFLGATLVPDSAVVFAEIISENLPYQTVVLVRSDYLTLGGFDALRGLKYCHPGYEHDERITNYVLEQLDWHVINLTCDYTKTILEQKFKALAQTFGQSCRPGRWTEDEAFDRQLKSQYSTLCDLCGPSGCSTKYQNPLNDTLSCLTNGGDFALSALKYTQEFFKNETNSQNYQYLCPDGTLSGPATLNLCTWTSQLHRLLLTSQESADLMKNYIKTKLPSYVNADEAVPPSAVEPHLGLLLQLVRTDRINLIDTVSLKSYVSERRALPSVQSSIQCGVTLNWSVTDEKEHQKCLWLQQAALTSGLQPVLTCVKSAYNDTISNLDNIKRGIADVAFADASYGYIAKRKNLSSIAFPETDTRQLSKIVIVVRNDSTWYGKLSDLKGRDVCLPEYGGKEWLAVIDLLRTQGVLPDSCDYGKIFSDFVGNNSCAPGANAADLDISGTDSGKFCSACYSTDPLQTVVYCNADTLNKYYGSYGSLLCLQDGSADYAVVDLNDLPRPYQRNLELHEQFKLVSKNGSLASYPGFEVDENAPIAVIVAGELVAKNGSVKYNDTILFLREIETKFGQDLEKPFKVFESFNGSHNVLFPDSTPGLTFDESTNRYIENFRSLLRNSETCGRITSGADRALFSVVVIAIVGFVGGILV